MYSFLANCAVRKVLLARVISSPTKCVHLATLLFFRLTDPVSPQERKEREASNHPVFLVKLRESELILGSTASFMIHVKGNPNPDVKL